MERFSNFNDPITGQNPFAPLPFKRPVLSRLLHLVYRVPLLLLFLIGVNTVPLLIKIKCHGEPAKKMVSNSVTVFDAFVLRYLFPGHAQFYDVDAFMVYEGAAILFIEECASNGRMVTRFKADVSCNGAIYMKYCNECVYVLGSKSVFYWRFLMCKGSLTVNVYELRHSGEYARITGVPKSVLGAQDKKKFGVEMNRKRRSLIKQCR